MQALTYREREIAHLVARGLSNRQIARLLRISEQTVKNHNRSIFLKLSVANRVELTIYVKRQRSRLRVAS